MRLFFIRYTKIAFTWLRLHKIFNIFARIHANVYYLTRFSAWVSKNRKIPFNDFPSKWKYEKRFPMYEWVLKEQGLMNMPIHYLEFGVAQGYSFKWFLAQNKHPKSRFHGFDTFTGLPEDWGPYKKGTFDNKNAPVVIEDERGRFYQGLFQQTLPGFLKEWKNEHRSVIMMDADLYSATLFVLTSLAAYLKKGDIILFDQFAVPTHEFKAFLDFTQSYYINLELIAAANNYYFVAFKVA